MNDLNIHKIIKEEYKSLIYENQIKWFIFIDNDDDINEDWFHGTPDARDIEQKGGFSEKNIVTKYVTNISEYEKIQNELSTTKNKDRYWDLMDVIGDYVKEYKYKKPVFLTDKYSVAKTYADPHRAFDYQNAEEKVIEVDVNCQKNVQINANGKTFRHINKSNVINGFVDAGIQEKVISELIEMFTFTSHNDDVVETDDMGAIADWLGFDCVDVFNVLDSYHGGKTKSTVKMVLNPNNIKLKNN